ncbi:UNVERIFIED_CONTAM: hypothetical protein NCL1_15188 [Trichonephila clavipes]
MSKETSDVTSDVVVLEWVYLHHFRCLQQFASEMNSGGTLSFLHFRAQHFGIFPECASTSKLKKVGILKE